MSTLEIREQSPDERKLRLVANDLIAGDILIAITLVALLNTFSRSHLLSSRNRYRIRNRVRTKPKS
jgi:hypothetical protein